MLEGIWFCAKAVVLTGCFIVWISPWVGIVKGTCERKRREKQYNDVNS